MVSGFKKTKSALFVVGYAVVAAYFLFGAIRGLYLVADAKKDCIAEDGWSAVIFACDKGPNTQNWAGYVLLWPLTFDQENESSGEKTPASLDRGY